MPTEVELRLVVQNQDAIQGVKELQKENQKLYDNNERNQKREKGLIADIEVELEKLKIAKRKAYSIEDIEKYNRKIKEAENDLKEYENAGIKANEKIKDSTKTLSGELKNLIKNYTLVGLAIAAIIRISRDLVTAFKDTEKGMRMTTVAGQLYKTLLNDLVHATKYFTVQTMDASKHQVTWLEKIDKAIKVGKMVNEQRKQERIDLVELATLRKEYNKLYYESADQTLTATQRLEKLTLAIKKHEEIVASETKGLRDRLAIVNAQIDRGIDSDKILDERSKLLAGLQSIEDSAYTETRRLYSQKTGLEQNAIDERKKMWDDYFAWLDKDREDKEQARLEREKKYNDLSLQLQDEYEKSMIESLEGPQKLIAQRNYALKAIQMFRDQLKEMGTLTPWQEAMFVYMGENVWQSFMKGLREGVYKVETKDLLSNFLNKDLKLKKPAAQATDYGMWAEVFGFSEEQKENFLNDVRNTVNEFENLLQEMTDRSADIAQQQVDQFQQIREALDAQIDYTQRELEIEMELYKAGYASNVTTKREEVNELQKLRDKSYQDELKAIEKQKAAAERQRQIESLIASVNLISAASEIFKQYSKSGAIGIALAIAMIGMMLASFMQAKTDIKSATQLAKGGHGEVNGKLHSEGGEPFLSHVEIEDGERWGVLSRRASRRYGPIFDNMVDSFNRDKLVIPNSAGVVNNVLLDTSPTNSRLERVESQLIKLNNYFEGQESTIDNGRTIISRRGNTVRTIKR